MWICAAADSPERTAAIEFLLDTRRTHKTPKLDFFDALQCSIMPWGVACGTEWVRRRTLRIRDGGGDDRYWVRRRE